MGEAAVEMVLVDPVLKVADPEVSDLFEEGRLVVAMGGGRDGGGDGGGGGGGRWSRSDGGELASTAAGENDPCRPQQVSFPPAASGVSYQGSTGPRIERDGLARLMSRLPGPSLQTGWMI